MTDEEIKRAFGWATLEPTDPVVAGSFGTWRLTYTVGEYGLDDGGTLMVALRFATDWGKPQFDDPAAPDYATVTTDGRASLRARFDMKTGLRPWRKGTVVDVFDDGLHTGERIFITFGDTSDGSPGSRAQTFCEYTFEWRVLVNPFATGEFILLPDAPEIEIVSGPAANLVVIVPSLAQVGETIVVVVKAEDEWGNPATAYQGTVRLDGCLRTEGPVSTPARPAKRDRFASADAPGTPPAVEGLPATYTFRRDNAGVHRFAVKVARPGEHRVLATDEELGISAVSNPLIATKADPKRRIYWGDLHGQSEETVGTNRAEDYVKFARDYAALDVVGHQGNDFQVTAENWAELQRLAREYTEPGRFANLLGYEWSGNTGGGGDHNVYYLRPDEPIFRSCHALIPDKSEVETDRYPIERLYEELRGRDAIAIPHVGGRRADLSRHDEEVVPLVEIYSAWGEFEWMLTESLAMGRRVGVVAGSDGHKGRPGASYAGASTFGVYGGLTAILAERLDPESIFEALRARCCYATSGQRIFLNVDANGQPMGSEIRASDPVTLKVEVAGTDAIRKVEVMRGDEMIHLHDPLSEEPLSDDLVRVIWSGARILGRNRATVWDGSLTIEGAAIEAAEPYAFDGPQEGLTEVTSDSVAWESITTGDEDGVTLRLGMGRSSDRSIEGARLIFEAQPLSFECALGDLGREAGAFDAGGIAQRVTVQRLPAAEPPRELSFEFTDPEPTAGLNAYWVRVTQDDGARAWSSPIFVHYER